ncbi:hypothetical protein J1N35_021709 [Gossypium stocksii]|uniref:Uncharacterized protein n=1 Tax=Gossypium stocksii TaxID=47602 RepID=A0A9D3VFC0_9ROSI|nr:hypothetical protein J1N35_021709 [Gossypium stocksii]
MKEQFRDYVSKSFGSIKNKLTNKDDTLEVMMTALKEDIAELKGEPTIYNASMPKASWAMPLRKKAFFSFMDGLKPWVK